MPFSFSLETLLKVRSIRVNVLERELALLQEEEKKYIEKKRAMESEISLVDAEEQYLHKRGIGREYRYFLQDALHEMEKALVSMETAILEKRHCVNLALQERKKIEKLKEKHYSLWQKKRKERSVNMECMGQNQLFRFWPSLSSKQQEHLLKQIEQIDETFFQRQRALLAEKKINLPPFEPYEEYDIQGSKEDYALGKKSASLGECGCLVVAGGQGTRLRYPGPKGSVPLTLVRKKSLFQLLAEKIKAASLLCGYPLRVALMTSPLNHKETLAFFTSHHFFGLSQEQVSFFSQTMLPLLDFEGNLFLESPCDIAMGPCGNGGALRHFVSSGIFYDWLKRGVKQITFIPIDNPLADPFDFELFGFHSRCNNEVSIKATKRLHPKEKVGIIVKKEGKPHVIEYSELPEESEKHILANLSLFCFSLDFVKKASTKELPLHKAKKVARALNAKGDFVLPEEPNAWKFEEFIFDVLALASNTKTLVYPRALTFAPLKNLQGEDSIDSVQKALLEYDRLIYTRISGKEPPFGRTFELDPPFYYPTREMLEKWRGKELPSERYIEA